MATPEEQITPADAAIVTTGTGRKGPEEHDLPESLKYDMDLCLEILRNVLGEYNPELLSTFDTVRHYAVEASAEHFAELKDPNPDQDGLKEAVNVIDNMTLHDAQLLARAFATYFHLANLSEENYRVSVLHERENNVSVDQAVDPINELTVAYHQLINETGPAKAKELLNQLEFHPVFTAHPTEARRRAEAGLGVLRANQGALARLLAGLLVDRHGSRVPAGDHGQRHEVGEGAQCGGRDCHCCGGCRCRCARCGHDFRASERYRRQAQPVQAVACRC